MKKRVLFVLLLIVNLVLISEAAGNSRDFYVNTVVVLPDISSRLNCWPGIGLGYNFNSKWSIQASGIFKKNESKGERYYSAKFYSVFLDLKYRFNKKRLIPYLMISEGLIFINSKDVHTMPSGSKYELKDSDFWFSIGGGAGLRYRLNKKVSVFIESRGYLILYQSKGVRTSRFFPFVTGISLSI
jgi:hypothetical protein